MRDFIETLREAYRHKEVTAAELARRVGKSTPAVWRALAGLADPPHSQVVRMKKALDDIRAERGGEAQEVKAWERPAAATQASPLSAGSTSAATDAPQDASARKPSRRGGSPRAARASKSTRRSDAVHA